MNKKPRVIICELKEQNAVHWWRSLRPFSELARRGLIDLQVRYGTVFPQDLASADWLVMAHAMDDVFLKLATQAKDQGCKLWVDMDDNLRQIPVHNIFHVRARRDIAKAMRIIAMADVFTVSTQELADHYSDIRTDAVVCPNAVYAEEIADEWTGHKKVIKGKAEEFPLVLWRGGSYALRDVWVKVNDLNKIARYVQEEKGVVAWMGAVPPFIDGQLEVLEWVNVNLFIKNLRELRPDYIWKPLEDIPFNKGKSNIALIEAACAGALCIGGDETDKWKPAIKAEEISNSPSWKRKRFKMQAEFILDQFEIRKVNDIRAALLFEFG